MLGMPRWGDRSAQNRLRPLGLRKVAALSPQYLAFLRCRPVFG